jgi:hypothetical protein
MTLAHQRLWLAAHSRTLLIPLVATAFMLTGAFFPGPTDPSEAWAFSSTLAAAIAAWFVVVTERAVPPQADAMLTAHAGGGDASRQARRVLVLEVAAAITVAFVAVPEIAGVLNPGATPAMTATAAGAHFACALFGGALGLALGRPVRGGSAFAGIVLVLVASAAVEQVAPMLAGPAGVSRAFAGGAQTPGGLSLLVTSIITVAYACAMAQCAQLLARWRG